MTLYIEYNSFTKENVRFLLNISTSFSLPEAYRFSVFRSIYHVKDRGRVLKILLVLSKWKSIYDKNLYLMKICISWKSVSNENQYFLNEYVHLQRCAPKIRLAYYFTNRFGLNASWCRKNVINLVNQKTASSVSICHNKRLGTFFQASLSLTSLDLQGYCSLFTLLQELIRKYIFTSQMIFSFLLQLWPCPVFVY